MYAFPRPVTSSLPGPHLPMPFPAPCVPQRRAALPGGTALSFPGPAEKGGAEGRGRGEKSPNWLNGLNPSEMSPPSAPFGAGDSSVSRSPRETPGTPGCSGRSEAARSRAGGEPCIACLPRWIRVENKMDFELLSLSAAESSESRAPEDKINTRCVLGWF